MTPPDERSAEKPPAGQSDVPANVSSDVPSQDRNTAPFPVKTPPAFDAQHPSGEAADQTPEVTPDLTADLTADLTGAQSRAFLLGQGLRLAFRLVALIVVIALAGLITGSILDVLDLQDSTAEGGPLGRLVWLSAAVYGLLTAIPFVPGAEIGMALLALFGASVAPLVYGATVVSLCLAYAAGRLISPLWIARWLTWLRLRRAADFMTEMARRPGPDRLALLLARSDGRLAILALRYRYLALALLINMPGNSILGGGGGLALVAGLSGLFAPLPYLLMVMVAVAPVPFTIMAIGL